MGNVRALAGRIADAGLAVLLAALLPAGIAALQGPAAAAVFGTDERQPLPPRYASLSDKIGLLVDTRTRRACTAFCVSEQVVGTAAHCVVGAGEASKPQPQDLVFRLGLGAESPQTPLAGAAEGRGDAAIIAGSDEPRMKPPIGATVDWAFVRLDAPACPAGGLKVAPLAAEEVRGAAALGRVYQISFHRDFNDWQLAFAGSCPVHRAFAGLQAATIEAEFAAPEQLLLHRCATGGASSGSPLLMDGENGPEVVGISVGTYVRTRVRVDGGTVVERLGSETIANTGVSAAAFAEPLEAFLSAGAMVARGPVRRTPRGPVTETGSTR